MKMCINQLFRPSLHFSKDGVGDCTKCIPDIRNVECKQFYPVTVMEFVVENLLTNGENYEEEKNA